MSDWPSTPHREQEPLPRVEDLPVVWEGYDRAWVEHAFDTFYRHIAQLDATVRSLEAVESFHAQAAELRADLRSIRAAGWSPYPRGYPIPSRTSAFAGVSDAVPRLALEVAFLVGIAVIVAVANFSALEIVAVILVSLALTFLIELMAARERRTPLAAMPEPAPPPLAVPAPPAVTPPAPATVEPQPDDGAGWAAFAEPSGSEALTIMGAIAAEREAEAAAAQVEDTEDAGPPVDEPEPEADAGDTITIPREGKQRSRRAAKAAPEARLATEPRHVRVLPAPREPKPEAGGKTDEYPAWERGFDAEDD